MWENICDLGSNYTKNSLPSLTHSLTHSLTQSPTHPLTRQGHWFHATSWNVCWLLTDTLIYQFTWRQKIQKYKQNHFQRGNSTQHMQTMVLLQMPHNNNCFVSYCVYVITYRSCPVCQWPVRTCSDRMGERSCQPIAWSTAAQTSPSLLAQHHTLTTHTSTHSLTHSHTHTHTHTHTPLTHSHTHTHTHTLTHITHRNTWYTLTLTHIVYHSHTHIHTHSHTPLTHTLTHTLTYTHTHTHTLTHIHTATHDTATLWTSS